MGPAEALEVAIMARISALWPGLREADCPLELPNSFKAVDKTKFAWGRVTLFSDSAPEWESAGPGSAERHFDRLQLEIFGPLGKRERDVREIADAWASMWRPQADGSPAIAGFIFQPTQILTIGRLEAPAVFKVDCLTAIERSFQP